MYLFNSFYIQRHSDTNFNSVAEVKENSLKRIISSVNKLWGQRANSTWTAPNTR